MPESSEVGGNEDFVTEKDAVNGNGTTTTSRAGSPQPTQTVSKCVHTAPTPCHSVAAGRCDSKACLIHCRELRAVAGGMDPDEAKRKSATGQLEGLGCEAHESKVRAKIDRAAEKRKYKAEAKELGKKRKTA